MSRDAVYLTPKRGQRGNLPPLFRYSARTTKILTEIRCNEPLKASEIIGNRKGDRNRIDQVVTSLVRQGLLRRYTATERQHHSKESRYLTINNSLPFVVELRSLLEYFSDHDGLSRTAQRLDIANMYIVEEPHELALETIFGAYRRTAAIMVVALVDEVDAVTIRKVTGSTHFPTSVLLYKLERDGIFRKENFGRSVLYSIADVERAPAFKMLARKLAEEFPRFESLAAAATAPRVAGGGVHKTRLRQRFGRNEADLNDRDPFGP